MSAQELCNIKCIVIREMN